MYTVSSQYYEPFKIVQFNYGSVVGSNKSLYFSISVVFKDEEVQKLLQLSENQPSLFDLVEVMLVVTEIAV